jgi:lipid II:glycine glycyltransferase (peptidoglycan interpeptide bridge formation enzyme)
MITVQEIDKKEVWEKFFLKKKEKTFLQSWNWGEVQKSLGNKIWRLGITQNGEIISLALVTKIKAKRGTFLLLQHPLEFPELLFKKLKEIGKEEKCDFIRVAPLMERDQKNVEIFRNFGFRNSPIHASAYESTWKLDLRKSQEEILAQMRKTTRYLIRQAEKNPDVLVEKSDKLTDFPIYQILNKEVAKRKKFVPFSDELIEKEFEIFSQDNQALWFFGKYKGEAIAAALVIFWSGIAFYHQAASSSKFTKLAIPYLIQWEVIKEAKRRACEIYDFWGYIDPEKNPHHPWAGPSLFKRGFGGYQREYVRTQDFPLKNKYWLIYLFETFRKFKRGL